MPAIERTIELNPAVASRLKGRVLQWGDESAVARLLARNRRPVAVVLCSDLLYGDGPPLPLAPPAEGQEEAVGRGERGKGRRDEEEEEKEEEKEEEEAMVGAAESLAITLSAVARTSECTVLSCHERR